MAGLWYTLFDYAAWYHACEAVESYLMTKWNISTFIVYTNNKEINYEKYR